jgi:hypothetical protein
VCAKLIHKFVGQDGETMELLADDWPSAGTIVRYTNGCYASKFSRIAWHPRRTTMWNEDASKISCSPQEALELIAAHVSDEELFGSPRCNSSD